MAPAILLLLPMIALVTLAAVIDSRTRRIPNWLTAALALGGIVQAAFFAGHEAHLRAWAGMGTGFGLTLMMFVIGAMGGGDVKLLAGIGAWVGPQRVVQIFAAAAIVGMVIVLWESARGGRLRALFRGSAVIVMNAAVGDLSAPPQRCNDRSGTRPLPYAVPVLAGTLVILLARGGRPL